MCDLAKRVEAVLTEETREKLRIAADVFDIEGSSGYGMQLLSTDGNMVLDLSTPAGRSSTTPASPENN